MKPDLNTITSSVISAMPYNTLSWLTNVLLLVALLCSSTVNAKTVTYDFNITTVLANPDGLFERKVVGINGQWPVPEIHVDKGDRLIVHVRNHLENQPTALHWHGLFLESATYMDGPTQVTQCEIGPGGAFTYNFTINQSGTYWYHSHVMAQYPDGLRGALIVHDPESPYKDLYNEEIVLTISDWFHTSFSDLVPVFSEPTANSTLLNESVNTRVQIKPDSTYLFRLINLSAFNGQYFWVEDHGMVITEVDGVYTKEANASMIYLAAGQRCSFLLHTKPNLSSNFPMVASIDTTAFMGRHEFPQPNVTGWLVYDDEQPLPAATNVMEFFPIKDMALQPYDMLPLLENPTKRLHFTLGMKTLNGLHQYILKDMIYKPPIMPTYYQALSSGPAALDPATYGNTTNVFVLEENDVVELTVQQTMSGSHPFHLHLNNFQIVFQSEARGGPAPTNFTDIDLPQTPVRRDTVVVEAGGYVVIRFKADNPGVALFHCHMEYHSHSALVVQFITAPLKMQEQTPLAELPPDHLAVCAAAGLSIANGSMLVSTEDAEVADPAEETAKDMSEAGFMQRIMENNKLTKTHMLYGGLAVIVLLLLAVAAAGYRLWSKSKQSTFESAKYTQIGEELTERQDG